MELSKLSWSIRGTLGRKLLKKSLQYTGVVDFTLGDPDIPKPDGISDAAVLCAGLCGFGLGATPNAMANMSAVCYKYHYSATPFLIVPIIGSMFTDIINTGIISLFLSIL